MSTETMMYPFHLSLYVNSLEEARKFYVELLGLELRRASQKSIHVDFFGHQLTLNLDEDYDSISIQKHNGVDAPTPHFGAVLPQSVWHKLRNKLIDKHFQFYYKPYMRFENTNHEQEVMFMRDPSGNSIELKYYTKTNSWA
ncbi:MAG: VOC family protein [Xenococcaceae cyanobacterium]